MRIEKLLTAMMEYLKNWSKEQGYKNLRIKTRNTRREMLSFLVKNNFNFYEIEAQENIRDNRICLEIHLSHIPSFRMYLTFDNWSPHCLQ